MFTTATPYGNSIITIVAGCNLFCWVLYRHVYQKLLRQQQKVEKHQLRPYIHLYSTPVRIRGIVITPFNKSKTQGTYTKTVHAFFEKITIVPPRKKKLYQYQTFDQDHCTFLMQIIIKNDDLCQNISVYDHVNITSVHFPIQNSSTVISLQNSILTTVHSGS